MGLTLSFKDIIIRLLLATIVGGVIGYEREYHNRVAGFRTQILVCVGANYSFFNRNKIRSGCVRSHKR